MLGFGPSPLQLLIANVATVAAAGGEVPDEYTRIAERWKAFQGFDSATLTGQLADSIIGTGGLDDLPKLRALALAGRGGAQESAELRSDLEGPVFLALRDAYEPVADSNYRALASAFNGTATALTKAAKVVDPDTPAGEMVTATDKARKAWTDAALFAMQLDEQIPALATAAELAELSTLTEDRRLPLLCDPGSLHRRRVWEAWDHTEGRAGRWAALIRLGIPIRALDDLGEYEPYRRPAPIEKRLVSVGRGMTREIEVDPEDAEHELSVAAVMAPINAE
ncbi:hypothetical protein ACPXB3_00490 [Gordonia sp. DT219]|uniref:hypothetical protein n=1 Tax=Gordonia sp. DT219 TaxID=3416658 RepID=UPI003CEEDB17